MIYHEKTIYGDLSKIINSSIRITLIKEICSRKSYDSSEKEKQIEIVKNYKFNSEQKELFLKEYIVPILDYIIESKLKRKLVISGIRNKTVRNAFIRYKLKKLRKRISGFFASPTEKNRRKLLKRRLKIGTLTVAALSVSALAAYVKFASRRGSTVDERLKNKVKGCKAAIIDLEKRKSLSRRSENPEKTLSKINKEIGKWKVRKIGLINRLKKRKK